MHNPKTKEQCKHYRAEHRALRLHHQEEIQIKSDHRPGNQKQQPYDRCLLKIFFEGFKKGLYRGALLISHQLECHIVNRRRGRADREDRNAAQDPKKIQDHHVKKLAYKPPNRIIVIKKSRKHTIPPFHAVLLPRLRTGFCLMVYYSEYSFKKQFALPISLWLWSHLSRNSNIISTRHLPAKRHLIILQFRLFAQFDFNG